MENNLLSFAYAAKLLHVEIPFPNTLPVELTNNTNGA